MPPAEQRAERILDAAADLVLRWGAKRVTVEEVARHAGVGKGTIYLHFATRESLFVRVLMRESLGLVDELVAAMRRDPAAVLPAEQARSTYLAVLRRPLLRAMFSRDIDVLGDLATKTAADPLRVLKADLAVELLRLLREHRLLRADTTLEVQLYTLNAVQTGFYLSVPLRAGSLAPETAADALARTIRDAVQTPRCAEPAALAAVAPVVTGMYQRFRVALATAVTDGPYDRQRSS
ncbi:MAG TPA: helix-turn-helix domain-containing protein [Pseudonocardia sp.]